MTTENNLNSPNLSRLSELQKRLNELQPLPVGLPKIYFIGSTGVGKSSVIKNILGTSKQGFPPSNPIKTTVAPTEYVLGRGISYKATFIFKNLSQLTNTVQELLEYALEKAYETQKKTTSKPIIEYLIEYLQETPDQQFRLKYLLEQTSLQEIANQISKILPDLNTRVISQKENEQKADEKLEKKLLKQEISKLNNELSKVSEKVLEKILLKVKATCSNENPFEKGYFQIQVNLEEQKELFIQRCKDFIGTMNSISPCIDYARIQGNIFSSWIPSDVEVVLIDSEGLGHHSETATTIPAIHYDYFNLVDAIVTIIPAQQAFTTNNDISTLKDIYLRGYNSKLLIAFSQLDKMEVADVESPTRQDKIKEVEKSLRNAELTLQRLVGETMLFRFPNESSMFYLSLKEGGDEESKQTIISLLKQAKRLLQSPVKFVEPEYDLSEINQVLKDFRKIFFARYEKKLIREERDRIRKFTREMLFGADGYSIFQPISDFEDIALALLKGKIHKPKVWKETCTEMMQKESLQVLCQEINRLLIAYARNLFSPKEIWEKCTPYIYTYVEVRIANVWKVLCAVIPENSTIQEQKMIDHIKNIVETAIKNCVQRYKK